MSIRLRLRLRLRLRILSVQVVHVIPVVVEYVPKIFPFSLPMVEFVLVVPPVLLPMFSPLGAPVVVPILQVRFPMVVNTVWGVVSALASGADMGQLRRWWWIQTPVEIKDKLFRERCHWIIILKIVTFIHIFLLVMIFTIFIKIFMIIIFIFKFKFEILSF